MTIVDDIYRQFLNRTMCSGPAGDPDDDHLFNTGDPFGRDVWADVPGHVESSVYIYIYMYVNVALGLIAHGSQLQTGARLAAAVGTIHRQRPFSFVLFPASLVRIPESSATVHFSHYAPLYVANPGD